MLSAGFCHIACICCRQRFRAFSNNSVTSAGWELHYKEYLVEFYLLFVLILVTIVQTYLYNCTKSFKSNTGVLLLYIIIYLQMTGSPRVGKEVVVSVDFQNPYNFILQKIQLRIDGPGLITTKLKRYR